MNQTPSLTGMSFAAVLLLAACSRQPQPEQSDAGGASVYACSNDFHFTVNVREDSAEVDLGQLAVTLPNVPSASGARYTDGRFTFWSKGDEAMLETPAGTFDDCEGERARDPWHAARLRGAVFRGLGQEPGWTVEIIPDRWIAYIGDYGRTRIFMPVPDPVVRNGATIYRSSTEMHDLEVVVRDTVCTDIMSGEQFEKSVEVRFDGAELRGCGRLLDS